MENPSANHAHLGELDYPLVRAKLRAWLALEELYSHILEAAEEGNRENFVSSMYSFISAALSIPVKDLEKCYWNEVTRAFREIHKINRPSYNFPIFKTKKSNKEEFTRDGWEYVGRDWYAWLYLIVNATGWSIEYVSNMDIDDAIALLQEIMVDEQQKKEWQWSMSEIAYPYDEVTKKSRFIPLDRPDWMKPVPKPIKKIRVKASELPVGIVLKWDTDNNVYTQSQ